VNRHNVNIESVADAVARDGFACLPALCDKALCRELMAASRKQIATVRAALGDREIGIGSAAGYDEIVQRSPGRWDIPIAPQTFGVAEGELPWQGLVKSLLGADCEPSFSGIVFSEPGSPAQQWHTDSPHESADHLPPHAINVLVALHDIPLVMGPTECAVGSHRLTNHLANTRLDCNRLVYQNESTTPACLVEGTGAAEPGCWCEAMTEGSCLIFDDRLLHRGLANAADRTRYVAYFSYRRKGYVGTTHFEASRSVFD